MGLAELTLACSWLLWNFKELNNALVSSSERKPLESLDFQTGLLWNPVVRTENGKPPRSSDSLVLDVVHENTVPSSEFLPIHGMYWVIVEHEVSIFLSVQKATEAMFINTNLTKVEQGTLGTACTDIHVHKLILKMAASRNGLLETYKFYLSVSNGNESSLACLRLSPLNTNLLKKPLFAEMHRSPLCLCRTPLCIYWNNWKCLL